MRGRERVLVLCWGISWRGHGGGCFGGHFPCRHSGADLYKVILSRAGFASVACSIAGALCRAHFPSHCAIHPMGRLGGALSGPASGSESGIVSCRYHRTRRDRVLSIGSPCKEWERKRMRQSQSQRTKSLSRRSRTGLCCDVERLDPVFVGDDITKRIGFVIQRKYQLPTNSAGLEGLEVADCIFYEEVSEC
jgi:hypothetical protein